MFAFFFEASGSIVNPTKGQHRFRMIHAGIPSSLLQESGDTDVPTSWLLL